MNSLDRVMTAIRGGIPDRVPVMEQHIDPQVMQEIMPGCEPLEFYEKFDVDGLMCVYDLMYEDVAPNIKRDSFGVLNDFTEMEGSFPLPVEPLIKAGMDPMKFLDGYKIPDPHDPRYLARFREVVRHFKGKKAIVFGMHTSMWFPMCVRGYENFMIDLYENPEFVHRLTAMFSDFFIDLERQAIEIGADIVLDGEDYAGSNGLVMSKKHIAEFLLPGLKRAVEVAKAKDVPFVKHCDGNIYDILDLLVDQGISCLNPIEPAAGMDIGDVKRRIGTKVSLWGNIDCATLLTFGSPEDVRKATMECIRTAAPGGGFILSSSNTIHSGVPAENFLAMVETTREYGTYPIRL